MKQLIEKAKTAIKLNYNFDRQIGSVNNYNEMQRLIKTFAGNNNLTFKEATDTLKRAISELQMYSQMN